MALDPVKNFAKCVVSLGYDDVATSIVLQAGDGAKLPTPATDGAFNLVWWNSTDYADPSDDPNKEIVRCTVRTTDTLTITRAQEGTTATTKNTVSKTYKMILAPTKKTIDDIVSGLFGTPFYVDVPNSRVGIGTTTPTHYVHIVLPASDNFFIDASTNQRAITEGVFRINHTPATSGTRPFYTVIDANGQGDTHAFVADFVATSIVAGDVCNLFEASIDTSNSSGGTVKAFVVDKVGAGSVNVIGLGVLAGCDVISQNSGLEVSADQGFKYDTGYTDTTTAFGSGASNVQIFVNDNDYIYVGHASTFDDIRVVLAIAASQNIQALFQYSAGAGAWATFNPSDSTNGFTVNGNITWQLPLSGWATDTVNAIANKYWIRIQRTRNSLTTPPTESTIKIITSTIYSWDKNGAVSIASLTLGTPLAVAQGGTGASTAVTAMTNLAFQSKARVYRTGLQTITTGTFTKVQLNTENYDTLSEFDSTTNYRFTASSAGTYDIKGQIYMDSSSGGSLLIIDIRVNNASIIYNQEPMGTTARGICTSTDYYLNANDYVELFVYHDSGANRDVYPGTTAFTFLSVRRVA